MAITGEFFGRNGLSASVSFSRSYVVIERLWFAIEWFGSHVLGWTQIRFVKRDAIGHVVMEDLSHRNRVVTMLFEIHWDGDNVGKVDTELSPQIPDASRIRS